MKRPLTILATIVLSAAVIYACGSTIPTGNTSFVTISIGGDSRTAKLHAEQATAWMRFKYFLADAKIMPEAQAYVPSVVQVIVVTVSAADITTPIVGIDTLTPDQTSSTIRIEVPNGAARVFTVEGIRGIDSTTYYRGTAATDLDGTEVNLPVSMNFVGPGIWVDPAQPLTANTTTCGATQATACATITHVLNTRPATTNNDVVLALAGNYIPGSVAAIETFPLQLKPGMALICMGTNFSSVIDVSTALQTAIFGSEGASIDNCMIKAAPAAGIKSGVDDQGTRMKINGVSIELSGSPSTDQLIGARLSNDSLFLESAVTGSGASLSVYGVQVNGGKPQVIRSSMSNVPYGVDLAAGAGNAVISGNTISSPFTSGTGIRIATTAKPVIRNNTISDTYTGILITAGEPQISGNTLENNDVGIEVTATAVNPVITQNSISCSFNADLFSTATTTLNVANNSWDHDSTTVPPGPEEWNSVNGRFDCGFGADICYQNGPKPVSLPANAAVPGGCLFPSPN